MHTVLQSPDILSSIFAHLDQADLARATQVCKLWNDWSDGLWSSLPTLAPILRLVFPFFFSKNGDEYIHSVPLYQLDKPQFAKLARSVRHLDASLAPSRTFFNGFNPNIPGLLLDFCEPGTPLFPRLQSLATECHNDAELLGVLSLLTPSLRSLDVSVHHAASDYMHELLSGIEDKTKNLEHLCLSYQQLAEKPSDAASETSQRETDSYIYIPPIAPTLTKSLRSVSIPAPSMSIDALFALSRLPRLESLAFTGSWTSEAHGDEWPELEESSFPALKRLVVPCCTIQAAIRLLAVLPDSTPLSELNITYSGEVSGPEFSEFCATLIRFRDSLLSIRLKGAEGNPEAAQALEGWMLDRLAQCSKLETLVLDVLVGLSDVEFEAFARQFPHIGLVHVRTRRVGV